MRTKRRGLGIVVVMMLLAGAVPGWAAGEGQGAARTGMVVEQMAARAYEWFKGWALPTLVEKSASTEARPATGEADGCRPGQSEQSCSIDPNG